MAKGTTGKLKRQVGHAYVNIAKAINILAGLELRFTPVHPGKGKALQVMCVTLNLVLTAIDSFCVECWGQKPSDYESWRNVIRRQGDDLDVISD